MSRGRTLAFLAIALFCLCSVLHAANYTAGSTIEVREGDSWTKVTVVQSEGRRVQVKYDDGTLEWVGPDRIRGAAGAGNPAPTATNPHIAPIFIFVAIARRPSLL
jgi:hypothetical protein